MSIKKYSSFEKASRDMWIMDPNEDYYKKLEEYFSFWEKLLDKKKVKKIRKFKSYNEFLRSKEKHFE